MRKLLQIKGAKSVPFGHDDHGIGIFGRFVTAASHLDCWHDLLRQFHTFRIISHHLRTGVGQCLRDGDRGCVPHVIGIGLERQAEQSHFLAAHFAPERMNDLAAHGAFALIVHLHDSFNDANRTIVILRGFQQGKGVLGKTASAIAGTGMEEF